MPSGLHRTAAVPFCLALLITTAAWTVNPAPPAPARAVEQAITSMQTAAGPELALERSRATGLVRFMSASKARAIMVPGPGSPDVRALDFVDLYGPAFGLSRESVVVKRVSKSDDTGMEHVRLQQVVKGIPVAGGEAIIHLRGNAVVSVLARTAPDLVRVATTPVLGAAEALRSVRTLLAKHLGIPGADLSIPRLEIFNPSLLDGGSHRPSRLAWFVEAQTFDRREYIWVDAETGAVLLNFNQMPHSRNREIYDAESGSSLPGTPVRSEGEGDTEDADTDLAYDFSGDTYDYFLNAHGRDSYDDAGAPLVSTVHYCPSVDECPYSNAHWVPWLSQMVYGEGLASADDLVAHEITHAVTERTAGLYYYMQSGALNESFSDIFGETVDLGNGAGSDDPSDRWLIGEDLNPFRNMMNPNLGSPPQPEKMSDSTFFFCGSEDNGGVHYNSGLPNLAYALMVDGGTFNGFTVTAIGLTKAAAIHYKVLTEYLVSGSDFADHYNATNQACTDLAGTNGITAGDCAEVDEALQAVEMNSPWACLPAQSDEPALCDSGETAVDLFFDDVDTSLGDGWDFVDAEDDPNCLWYLIGGFATSGSVSFYSRDRAFPCTTDLFMLSDIDVPASGGKFRFHQSFDFQTNSNTPLDGGLIIVSTDSGATWHVADCGSCDGFSYNGTLTTGSGNLSADQDAFTARSFGFTISQLDLGNWAGQSVRFGFRVITDSSDADSRWWLDDIRIFECVAPDPEIFSDGFEGNNTSAWSSTVGGP